MAVRHSIESIGGFAVHTVENEALRLSLVPALGGRIVSLVDRAAGREWIDGWEPAEARRLWQPTEEGVYTSGPMAGIDECLPTVLACQVDSIALPDHGDLWNNPCDLDEEAAGRGTLTTRWTLRSLPLTLKRTICLEGTRIRLEYVLENLAAASTPFLWCWHPLFHREEGDEIRLAEPVKKCVTPEGQTLPWPHPGPGEDLSRADLGEQSPSCAKVFLGPLQTGRAEIRGRKSTLTLQWPPAHVPWLGIWINEGAVNNLHHWGLEPTNCPVDFLSQAPAGDPLTLLEAGEVRRWTLQLTLGKG